MAATRPTAPIHQGINGQDPVFLSVKKGMTVICGSTDSDDWWMADVDSGVIRWVCADLVTHIVPDS